MHRLVALGLILSCGTVAFGQPPSDAERAGLQKRLDALQKQVAKLDADAAGYADTAVCAKAVDWMLRHGEYPKADQAKKAAAVLELGERRAAAVAAGKVDRNARPGGAALGYVSDIDGSVQPYALNFPEGYDAAASKRWPLYVVLHGRNGSLTEVGFLADFHGKKPAKRDFVQLDVYGRGNNAFRWAGETDVFEAIADARRRFKVDDRRVVLWGFSMGGAGAWHLGLHHPSRWAAAGAGAGFVDFYRYQNKTDKLPPYQDATLHIYDAADYALNLADVPFVTYGGELDKQLLAGQTMAAAAKEVGVPVELIVGKGAGHKFTPEGEQAFQAFLAQHAKAGRPLPNDVKKVRLITYTPKYNRAAWVAVEELDKLYEPAVVEAELADAGDLARVTTLNVAALRLARDVAADAEIDGVRLPLRDAARGLLPDVVYVRAGTDWRALDYDASREFLANPDRHKRRDLQGPIDDAFMQPFVCVKPTGAAWSEPLAKYADWSLARFGKEFDKYLRGQVPVVTADGVTPDMIGDKNLVLFGDPGSNPLIAKLLPELPIEWTKDRISVGGKTYDPQTHAVVMIYPNPLNSNRYVVLNTGHTFHADAFNGTNALLYPRLGDIASIKFTPDGKGGYTEETAWAELFDAAWQLPQR